MAQHDNRHTTGTEVGWERTRGEGQRNGCPRTLSFSSAPSGRASRSNLTNVCDACFAAAWCNVECP